jgi:hypothetical protein
MKGKHPMTYTSASIVTEKSQEVWGVYLDMNNIALRYTLRVAYEVIASISPFNIFADIRYLIRFFGVWTLEIVPTPDNMVCEVIDYDGLATNTYTHVNRETAFQF